MCEGKEICCWIEGVVCPFLRDDGINTERRYVCTLREKYGNWNDVHNDAQYKKFVQPYWIKLNIKDCGTYTCDNCK
jgi:hypothetical protein